MRDPNLHIDVFVTDVIMPGLKGPEWVAQAREVRSDLSVVFVSGYAEEVFSDNSLEILNSSFLQKPFSLAELAEVVQKAVAQPEPMKE